MDIVWNKYIILIMQIIGYKAKLESVNNLTYNMKVYKTNKTNKNHLVKNI